MHRDLKKIISQMTLEEKAAMCSGLDFWHLKSVERLGIPEVMVSDGPHGLRKQDDKGDHLGMNDSIKAVCFPPAALSACSFDRSLMEAMGETIGREAQANDVSVVLGPAVNIKRSPLCGRNFEYYSECGVLSGLTAAAEVSGATENGLICYVKHFAFNDQDNYRQNNICTWLNEQSAREIYLKAFEQPIKAGGMGVMTSMNAVGPVWAGGCKALLTNILRDEWGFHGAVITDAVVSAWYMDGNLAIRTGGTKMLAFNITNEFYRDLNSVGTVTAMRNAAHGTLYALSLIHI